MPSNTNICTAFIEPEEKYIPLQYQPACLIDLALARDVDSHQLLRGTGLFYEQINQHPYISAAQFLRLFSNVYHTLQSSDISFQLGQRLLPGHCDAISTALAHACDLATAIAHLQRHRFWLSPILSPRLHVDDHFIYLYWLDVTGVGSWRQQWVETMSSAIVAMSNWQSKEHLPWRFLFHHSRPKHIEQYHAFLGHDLHFDCHVDAMILPRHFWQKPWPRGSQTVAQLANNAIESGTHQCLKIHFVEHVYEWLAKHVQRPCTLETVSAQIGISTSTCKRKLAAHGYSFQRLHDDVRKNIALYLYWVRDYRSDEVAHYLGFRDKTNFRRSFKRWTGHLPSVLRQHLPQT